MRRRNRLLSSDNTDTDSAVKQPGIQMRKAEMRRYRPGNRPLPRRGRPVNGDSKTHGATRAILAPSAAISGSNIGNDVAIGLASSTVTGSFVAIPSIRKDMAIL